MRLPYRLPWHDQRPNGISTFRTAGPIHTSQHGSVVVPRVRGGPVAVWVPEVSCLCPGMREAPGVLWGCVGLGRECFGYAKAPWGVCSEGLPVRVMRRRATLPHPVGCSTIAVPGLSFRVRNGTGRLTWAMAAANLLLYGQTLGSAGLWRPGNRTADADVSMFRLVARQCSLPSGAVCRRKMRSNRQGLECQCCLSSVSTGRLHPSRGFHVRPINHVFCMGTTGTRRFHGMLILEQASRLDAFSGYPFRT